MTQKDEWGPWIEHDGVPPLIFGVVYAKWEFKIAVVSDSNPRAFLINNGKMAEGWTSFKGRSWRKNEIYVPIIRYRIRKPRGMAILESILADMPETIHSKEDV